MHLTYFPEEIREKINMGPGFSQVPMLREDKPESWKIYSGGGIPESQSKDLN